VPFVFIVDNSGDTDDGNYTSGQLTLREAIKLSNTTNVGGSDIIKFHSSLNGATIDLSNNFELAITDPGTIQGLGSSKLTITGLPSLAKSSNRIFNVNVPSVVGTVTISGMTLTGGNTTVAGGAILDDNDTLVLSDLVFTGNKATTTGGAINIAT